MVGQIQAEQGVEKVNYLSRDEALGEFRNWSGFGGALDMLEENPLPAVAVVIPKLDFQGTNALNTLRDRITGIKGIDEVRMDDSWFARLSALTGLVGRVAAMIGVLMVAAVLGVISFLPQGGVGGSFDGFFAMFLCLFALTGIGNGSTFMQVPVIFLTFHQRLNPKNETQSRLDATREAAAVLGFSGAIGAYGGFFIPKSFGTSIDLTGGVNAALYAFIVFYLSCLVINWFFYARKGAEVPC